MTRSVVIFLKQGLSLAFMLLFRNASGALGPFQTPDSGTRTRVGLERYHTWHLSSHLRSNKGMHWQNSIVDRLESSSPSEYAKYFGIWLDKTAQI
jgi:hypothetical protein